MPLLVGNLLVDPGVNSFISDADAVAYLTVEAAPPTSAVGRWLMLDETAREGSLVRASRWMADVLSWRYRDMTDVELTKVAQVAARLAASSVTLDLYSSQKEGKFKRVKADTVEVEYREGTLTAQAAGYSWPWLLPALDGLLRERRRGIGVLVV